MVRRREPPFNGHRYVGDKKNRLVHDLDREARGLRGCRVVDILVHNVETFDPDTLREAYRRGFDYCPCCIGEA